MRLIRAALLSVCALLVAPAVASAARNLTILNAATTGVTESPPGTYTATGDNAVLNVTTLNTALTSRDVTVVTSDTGAQAGQITVGAQVNWGTARELTLDAVDDVVIESSIVGSDPGGGALTAEAVGSILQNSSGTIHVGGPTTLNAGLGLDLNEADNDFSGPVSIQSPSAPIEIKDTSALDLGTVSANGGVIEAFNGHLTQSGAITSGGEFSATAFTVTLNNPGNDFDRLSVSGNAVSARDANALELTGFSAAVAGIGAGTDLSVTDPTSAHFANQVQLVADAAAGSAVGPGGIDVAPGVAINSNAAPLAIYTARRDQNTFGAGATLNGATFTPGPEFVDSPTEVWDTASPNGTATDPFTIFYKQAAPLPPEPPTPETTLTRKPKKKLKTRKRKAKVAFGFESSVAGSSFTCELDGRERACSSPFEAKVKKGKHVFGVVATAAGKTDPTPAEYRFKVKRKRR